jgi:hypothetical protein
MNEGSLAAEFDSAEATQEKIMGAILRSGKKDITDVQKDA